MKKTNAIGLRQRYPMHQIHKIFQLKWFGYVAVGAGAFLGYLVDRFGGRVQDDGYLPCLFVCFQFDAEVVTRRIAQLRTYDDDMGLYPAYIFNSCFFGTPAYFVPVIFECKNGHVKRVGILFNNS